jgi:protein-S-isoprenylcysteine O-methyltransferase Ste14
MNLVWKLVGQFVFGMIAYGALFFLSAGTLRYWEAWAYLAVMFIPGLYFCVYFYRRDPELVRRRLQKKEKVEAQKWIMRAAYTTFFLGFLIPGLDQRYGWTRQWVGRLPLWVEILSLCIVLGAYLAVIRVMDVNRYAARTIQVEEGQQVISTGPYQWVRHPFYTCSLVMMLFSAPALGSLAALPVVALTIPVFVLRLLNEEKVLRQGLAGYAEYCERTRWRLVPYMW